MRHWPNIGQSVAKLWAALRVPLTKHCFELDAFIVLEWLINVTSVYYTWCRKFSWSHETVTCLPTASASAIAFFECLQWFYKLPSKKDQRIRLSLASFGCGLKLKICLRHSLIYLHCHSYIWDHVTTPPVHTIMADQMGESKHFTWRNSNTHGHCSCARRWGWVKDSSLC